MNDIVHQAQPKSLVNDAIICVIVTYADRRTLLRTVLDTLPEQGVRRVIVVDNGACWAVESELEARYGDFVDLVEMGHNTGSAGGFTAGIKRALELGAEHIWLLDDDNRPAAGCLDTLLAAYYRLRVNHPPDRLAVLAFRPEHQADVATGVPPRRVSPRRNAFRGFHLLDIPYKFWHRTPWGQPRIRRTLPDDLVDLPVAPYSGLLFHRTVVESIGLPLKDFVLYGDDREYTHRLTHSGGSIALVMGAVLEDLESSWNVRQTSGSSFGVLLNQGSDFRVYYGMRNSTYFEAYHQPHDHWMFWLNRRVFLVALAVLAHLTGHTERYRLVTEAVKDGLSGRLGLNPRFPL